MKIFKIFSVYKYKRIFYFQLTDTKIWWFSPKFGIQFLTRMGSLNFGLVRYILSVRVLSTLFHGLFLSFFSEHLIFLIFHLQNNTQMLKKQPKRKDLWTRQAFLSSKPIQETLVLFAFKSTFLADFTCFKVKCFSFYLEWCFLKDFFCILKKTLIVSDWLSLRKRFSAKNIVLFFIEISVLTLEYH